MLTTKSSYLIVRVALVAQQKPRSERYQTVRQRLNKIQDYCTSVGKKFIVCELQITCDQYDLGGNRQINATLFRGPNEDASVAICMTEQGSLLHRNDSPWKDYCDAGDINPVKPDLIPMLST